MKNLKLIFTTMALMLTVLSATANDNGTIEPLKGKSDLRSKIVSILGKKAPIKLENNKEVTAKISLLLNQKNELIVISVDSGNTSVDAFVKNKLNYKKVNVRGIKKGEIYEMPLKIKQG